MSDISIVERVKNTYPDFTEDKAKALVMRTLSWLTVLGSTTAARIDEAKAKSTDDIEERAIILAASVVSRVIAAKYTTESDNLNALVDCLLTWDDETATSV